MTPGDERLQEERTEAVAASIIGGVLWLLVLAAVLAIIAHYVFPDTVGCSTGGVTDSDRIALVVRGQFLAGVRKGVQAYRGMAI